MKRITLFLLFLSQISPASEFRVKAHGEQLFHLSNLVGKNQIVFSSHAPLENLVGVSDEITGWVKLDPANVETATGEAVIPATTFQTGIDIQDHLMQGAEWLDATKYPVMTFVLKGVHVDGAVSDNQLSGSITGELTFHGVTKTIVGRGTTTYLDQSPETLARAPGDFMCVNGSFDVSLKDFGISGKAGFVGAKIAETIHITVTLFGSNKIQ